MPHLLAVGTGSPMARYTMIRTIFAAAVLAVSLAAAPASAATLSTTFTPVVDAYVSSAANTTNFGTATQLSVSLGTDVRRSFLRFTTTGLTAPVTSATLRVWSQTASSDGFTLHD